MSLAVLLVSCSFAPLHGQESADKKERVTRDAPVGSSQTRAVLDIDANREAAPTVQLRGLDSGPRVPLQSDGEPVESGPERSTRRGIKERTQGDNALANTEENAQRDEEVQIETISDGAGLHGRAYDQTSADHKEHIQGDRGQNEEESAVSDIDKDRGSTAQGTQGDHAQRRESDVEPGAADQDNIKRSSRPKVNLGGSLLERATPVLSDMPILPKASTQSTASDDDKNFEPGEIVLLSLDMKAAMSAARALRSFDMRIKFRQQLRHIGRVLSVFRLADGSDVQALLAVLRKDFPDLNTDVNQRYQMLGDDTSPAKPSSRSARKTYARRMINWPAAEALSCLGINELRLGMVDTHVNIDHPAFSGQALMLRNFAGAQPFSAVHGSAVASLLVGAHASDYPGLLPGAKLWAAGVFRQRQNTAETTTQLLLQALDWLLSERVSVINLSMGGPRNRILALGLSAVLDKGVMLVAAAGNQGAHAPPAYPAAHHGVIAVTAVDALGGLYSLANQGEYIDFSAPGVDIWAADGEAGGRYHSGTSFAVPFALATLVVQQRGVIREQSGRDWLQGLQQKALDLGPKGKDSQFGWGLIEGPRPCPR